MGQPEIITLPKITDPRGNLSVIEELKEIPFKIERTYWIYDVPGGEERGGHAYKENQEFIVALSGSFDVVLDWREMVNFSTNSLALVLSSTKYNSEDYIRDYQDFLKYINND